MISSSFGSPALDKSYKDYLNEELEFQVEELQCQIKQLDIQHETLLKVLNDPDTLSKVLLQDKDIFKTMLAEYKFIGSSMIFKYIIDPRLKAELYSAILSYTGPVAKVTSCTRLGSKGSYHQLGRAVDLEANEEVIAYLHSDLGQKWIEDNNLTVYIEDNVYSKFLKNVIKNHGKDYIYINRRASGPHIHISRKYDD